jgi:hypothetical protein
MYSPFSLFSQSLPARRTSQITKLDFATTIRAHELLLYQMKPLFFLRDFSIAEKENGKQSV